MARHSRLSFFQSFPESEVVPPLLELTIIREKIPEQVEKFEFSKCE